MRRFQQGLTLIALPVFVCTLFLAGCGKDTKKADNSTPEKNTNVSESSGPAKLLEPKGGVLTGKVTLKSMPNVKELTDKLHADIAEKKDQKDFCMSGSESETTEQVYRIGANKLLGNVFVWIKPEKGTLFKVDDKQVEDAKKNPIHIHQPHCAFIPHCAIVFAEYHPDPKKPKTKKKTGQIIVVTNNAEKASHNTNYEAGPNNPKGDQTLAAGKEMKIEDLKADLAPMKFKCGIHPWMDAYVQLLDTPYFALTHSDTLDKEQKVKKDSDKFGTYEIKNLPVGVKVRVFAWHERAGWLNKNEGKGEEIEIKEGAPTTHDFEAEPK